MGFRGEADFLRYEHRGTIDILVSQFHMIIKRKVIHVKFSKLFKSDKYSKLNFNLKNTI